LPSVPNCANIAPVMPPTSRAMTGWER
jgi:hypothetical protein